ncbi:MAG: hypothetical protein HEQ32_06585 [Vampirovibrio sp.]
MNIRPLRALVGAVALPSLMSLPVSAQTMKKAELAAKPVYVETILCLQDSNVVSTIIPDPSLEKGGIGLNESLNELRLLGTKAPNTKRKAFFTFKKGLTSSVSETIRGLCEFLDPRSNGAGLALVSEKKMSKAEQKIYQNSPDSTKDFSDALQLIDALKEAPPEQAPSSTLWS